MNANEKANQTDTSTAQHKRRPRENDKAWPLSSFYHRCYTAPLMAAYSTACYKLGKFEDDIYLVGHGKLIYIIISNKYCVNKATHLTSMTIPTVKMYFLFV